MSSPYNGLGVRHRTPVSARREAAKVGERFAQMRENGERLVAEPFRGLTTDGTTIPDLFPIQATGISTAAIRTAVGDLLDALDADQRRQVQFDVTSDAWRRWWNIHPFLMRHGLLLEDLAEAPRAAALRVLEQTLSAVGYRTARDVMRLNHTIGEITGSWTEYGEWVYFISVFGTPSRGAGRSTVIT